MKPRVVIDLDAVRHNARLACKTHERVWAVVKANAYGHGAEQVVSACDGVYGFCVARAEEALCVRAHTRKPILVLGRVSRDEMPQLIAQGIALTVTDEDAYCDICTVARSLGAVDIYLKYNCGMNRYGMDAEGVERVLSSPCDAVKVQGTYSHLPSEAHWDEAISQCATLAVAPNHLAATSAAHRTSACIRLGLGLYGYGLVGAKRAMRVTATVQAVRTVQAGQTVGYGMHYRAERDCDVAIVGIGYGDGFPRLVSSGYMTVGGSRCPIVGAVCMDVTFLDVTGKGVQVGDEVTVLDDAERLGNQTNISPYALLCGWTDRVERVWLGE
jgi:alanine racemase